MVSSRGAEPKAIHPEPVRRPRREDVRRRLLDAAAATFLENGYDDSKLDDIARRAGLSKGAVYSNFASKQEIFGAMLAERIGRAGAIVSAAGQPGSRASIAIADDLVADAAWVQLVLEFASRAGRDPAVRDIFAPFLRTQRETVTQAVEQALGSTTEAGRDFAGQVSLVVIALRYGLALAHGGDPDHVSGDVIERTIDTVLTALLNNRPT